MNPDNDTSQVRFDNERWGQRRDFPGREVPAIPRFVISHSGGRIQTEAQANYVLIGFICLMAVISIVVSMGGVSKEPPRPREILRPMVPLSESQ